MITLVYGGLFLYFLNDYSTRKDHKCWFTTLKLILLFGLYSFTISCVWLMFKGEENHRNEYSGLENVSYSTPALFFIAGITLYSVMLFFMDKHFKKRKINKSNI